MQILEGALISLENRINIFEKFTKGWFLALDTYQNYY